MKKVFIILLLLTISTTSYADQSTKNQICQACHPKIYKEYQSSLHAKSSIYTNEVLKKIWEKHPLAKTNDFKCAKCHTPSDKKLVNGESKLAKNDIQLHEPISCQYCHKIESIEKHKNSNKNIQSTKEDLIFARDIDRKGEKQKFKVQSSLTKMEGSPYHDIDYSNENFYNGNVCMGCHSHNQNKKGFLVCDFEVKKGDSEFKETCISCHMPQIAGSFVNHKDTKTHAFHGATALISKPFMLSKFVKLMLEKSEKGFVVTIENRSNHTLVHHPLRLAKLKLSIERDGGIIELKDKVFVKIIGTNGKPSVPWLADEIIKDSTIKAFEKRKVVYDTKIKSGDKVIVRFGYHIINPKIAQNLQLQDKKLAKFVTLTKKNFNIKEAK
jgi:hypothetical protein